MRLVLKGVPPYWTGQKELRHEANIYARLSSLQGTVIPKMYGLFEGEGWVVLVLEDCGCSVNNIDSLSLAQR